MERGEIAPEEQFLLSSIMFCYLMLDFYVKTRIRFSLRDKRLFEITEVEITRVDCTSILSLQELKCKDIPEMFPNYIFDIREYFEISEYETTRVNGIPCFAVHANI